MNTCLYVLKETKWILNFLTCLIKVIEYFPDYLSALSRTLLRFFGQPLSKQLYIFCVDERPRFPCGPRQSLFDF